MGDDVLPVGSEEVARVQHFGQFIERLLEGKAFTVSGNGLYYPVVYVEIHDVLHADGYKAVALYRDEEVAFVALFALQAAHDGLQAVVGGRCGGSLAQQFQLVDGLLEVGAADGFQQVGNAVHPECLQGVLVVGGGEDDGAGDVNVFEDAEGGPVGQVYVHEYQFGHGVGGKPFQAAYHTVGFAHYFKVGVYLVHGSL